MAWITPGSHQEAGLQEYHEQINGFAAFEAWHSSMFPGQQLEMDPWRPTVAKDVPFSTMTRSVMYTMCMDVPYYVRSLTTAFNCARPPSFTASLKAMSPADNVYCR